MHVDQAYVQPAVSFQIGLNILWFLEDVSDANGGTRILPGSHGSGVAPADPPTPSVVSVVPPPPPPAPPTPTREPTKRGNELLERH